MRNRWMILGSLLLLALILAGCGLVAESDAEPAGGDPARDGSSPGTVIITVETEPAAQSGAFQFTGVPSGTITTSSALVVADLEPGTYTTTQVDPAPDFDLVAVRCDDDGSPTASGGDPQTRSAILNVDPGETIECTFTNAQRGSAVVVSRTIPDGTSGSFLFTGTPTGTVPAGGTLVVANLRPGTYTTTEADPTPEFDLVAVSCDDDGSPTASSGDPQTRSAIFNIDPGEMVQCTFTNARRGTVIVAAEVSSESDRGSFQYTGVPSGTVSAGGELVVADLPPGTYTTTEVDPAPDFELTEVACDDGASATSSSGDASTRTAIFNLDAGETVRCVFSHEVVGETNAGSLGSGSPEGATNPFENPDRDLADFPLPEDLPADAGSSLVPKAGPWTVDNLAGEMDCGGLSLDIPVAPRESGIIEVLDGGQTLIGSSLQEDQTAPVTMSADPEILGRYTGAIGGTELGVPITINYVWQVVTEEYIVGYLTSSFTAEGATCSIYRPYVLNYAGEN